MNILIEAQGIVKKFGQREVVKGIDIQVQQGEVLALIGTNGAGKSTTLSMLLGIQKPDSGTVKRWRSDYRAHIGAQLQSTPFFEGYTTEENLRLFAALYHVELDEEQIRNKLEACSLLEVRKTMANALSGGQQKRLAIAITTIHDPDLVVLDEPMAGLDPRARHEIRGLIRRLADRKVTVLFSSHDMEEVSRSADRMILLHRGEIVAQGSPQALLQEYQADDLEELYLRLTEDHE